MPLTVEVEYLDNPEQAVAGNRKDDVVNSDDSMLRTDPEYLCMCRPFFSFFSSFFFQP